MNALFAAALATLAPIGSSLAADYNPPFEPIIAIGGQTRLIYPEFPVELLATEAETGEQLGIVVVYTKPNGGTDGNQVLEYKLTEVYYVLEGQHRFFVGDRTVEGGPGTIIVNPPNVPHGFTYIGTGIGKLLIVSTPSDGTHGTGFFTRWAEQMQRSPEWIAKTNQAYGIDRPAP